MFLQNFYPLLFEIWYEKVQTSGNYPFNFYENVFILENLNLNENLNGTLENI